MFHSESQNNMTLGQIICGFIIIWVFPSLNGGVNMQLTKTWQDISGSSLCICSLSIQALKCSDVDLGRNFPIINILSRRICSKFQYNCIQTQTCLSYCGSVYMTLSMGLYVHIVFGHLIVCKLYYLKSLFFPLPKSWNHVSILGNTSWHSALTPAIDVPQLAKAKAKARYLSVYVLHYSIKSPCFLI